MTAVFADTFYYLALLNDADAAHEQARALSRSLHRRTVTTDFVLMEVADALAAPKRRHLFTLLLEQLRRDPYTTIVEADRSLFDRGARLYEQRPDKSWSLTDCLSFFVMTDAGLTEALTGDQHFVQAGYVTFFA
jgi:predicted nucleic acid-binding protein